MSRLHIADTGLFVAMGQPSNSRYQAVRRFARRTDIALVLPERVYEELTIDDPDVEEMPSQLPHPTSLTLTGSLVEGGACP